MSKKFISIPGLIIAFIIFAAVGVALAGFTPQEFGHTADEIDFITQEKSVSCTGKSCELKCDPGYAVFAGSCESTALGKWNLVGARANHEYWDCVDGSANYTSTITVESTCVKTYFDNSGYVPVCGNYIVDDDLGEVCDGPNTKDIDCEDFFTTQGTQLCNGSIGACSPTCDGIDIAACEYCSPGTCTPPLIECADGSCALNCSNNGGPLVGSGTTVGSTPSPGGYYFPPGPPMVPPPVTPGPVCGDGQVNQPSEQCDGDPVDCGPPICVVTDPGEPAQCYPWICQSDCTCWTTLP